jgi:hypothetical protein
MINSNNKILSTFLILFLFADLTYSFLQHYSMPIDGDLAGGVIPAVEVNQILEDPFAFRVIVHDEKYPIPIVILYMLH